MDDTFVIHHTEHKDNFLQHINSIDSVIKFTIDDTTSDASMPFLYTLVTPKHIGTVSTRVNRKPTHTDQYLQWDNHHIGAKYSVINTLNNRSKTVSSITEHLRTKVKHIRQVLTKSGILHGH